MSQSFSICLISRRQTPNITIAMQREVTLILLAAGVLALATMHTVSGNAVPQLCDPNLVEEMPPQIKKVCLALENSNQLSNALTAYLRNEASGLMFRPEELVGSPGTGKRTDVDHVFLRFGRKRR